MKKAGRTELDFAYLPAYAYPEPPSHPQAKSNSQKGRDGAAGHVRELDVLGEREIPRPAEARLSSAQISSNPDDKLHSQKERHNILPLKNFAFLGDRKA